ncbi:MAG: ferritin-like domain-containing protein [bacterium]
MSGAGIPKFKTAKQARDKLYELLQQALMLELSTIPVYATACYSIQEQGQYNRSSPQIANAEPIEVIRQVMVEEMLHMVLVANIINAIGFQPCVNDPTQLPKYPHQLLKHSDFKVNLRRFSPDQIKAFREIERAPVDLSRAKKGQPETIGGFYAVISILLEQVCNHFGVGKIFTGHIDSQINSDDYYGAGGEVIVVHNLKTAQQAILEIVEEGEGAELGGEANDKDRIPSPELEVRWDVAHYFKFDGILHSRYYQPSDRLGEPPTGKDMVVDWRNVWPMKDDPCSKDYKNMPEIQALSDRFNDTYTELLNGLNDSFNGNKAMLASLMPVMYRLKEDAQRLMRVPLPGNELGETAGPTWEYRC